MKLPLHIAQKLQQLLGSQSSLPASVLKHAAVTKMLEDGMLQKQQTSNTKAVIFIAQKEALAAYLHNHFGIGNLDEYIIEFANPDLQREAAVSISGNSKLAQGRSRTFKGFLVNCYQPIHAVLNEEAIVLQPAEGSFHFIYDFETFVIDKNITIVGVENPRNFRKIKEQAYLFNHITPLFISRYPQQQTADVRKWLQSIPNNYLHFGDFDFESIQIYLSEHKKHLGHKASFFLPAGTEELLKKYGRKELFDIQFNNNFSLPDDAEEALQHLTSLLLKYKKGLEQEIFINGNL